MKSHSFLNICLLKQYNQELIQFNTDRQEDREVIVKCYLTLTLWVVYKLPYYRSSI